MLCERKPLQTFLNPKSHCYDLERNDLEARTIILVYLFLGLGFVMAILNHAHKLLAIIGFLSFIM